MRFIKGILLYISIIAIGVISSSAAPDNPCRVVCTTTHLAAVIQAVAGDTIEVKTIVPFGMCPGHFDISPGDIKMLDSAPLIVSHGYEMFLKGIPFSGQRRSVSVSGNWMIPEVQEAAAFEMVHVLSDQWPEHKEVFVRNAERYKTTIDALWEEMQGCLQPYRGLDVMCSSMNQDWIEAMGFHVVDAFPRDEDVTSKTMMQLIDKAKNEKVCCVIDNQQSHGKVGKTIAEEADVPFFMISNFPSMQYTDDMTPYEQAVRKDITLITSSLNNDAD